jgi:uroporphyrinogen-III synthase
MPAKGSFDALLIGSANALRHGGPAIAELSGMPAYAIGETTALTCRNAGLQVVATGEGGLQTIFSHLKATHTRLLRLAGAARVALNPPPGITIIERVVYASEPLPMPPVLAELLNTPAVVALHSAEAARHFRAECDAKNIDLGRVSLAAIGPRVALAAGTGWHALQSASTANDSALLALAGELCKEAG